MKYPELKIKIKSLAAEATIIRGDERKHLNAAREAEKANRPAKLDAFGRKPYQISRDTYGSLRHHRVFDIRIEQRATLIAYGYLRGRAYRQIEQSPHWLKAPYCRPGPDWARVTAMIVKYAGGDKKVIFEQLKEWRKLPLQQQAA